MSRTKRHIKSQYNIINEVSYAILQQSTTTTIISKKIMEANEEKTGVRQKSKVVHTKSKLVKDKKTKRQEEKKNFN